MRYDIPVWEMVKRAAQQLPGPFTPKDIIRKVQEERPHVKANTIRCHVIGCSPNHPSSKNYSMPNKVLEYLGSGRYRLLKENEEPSAPIISPKSDIVKIRNRISLDQLVEDFDKGLHNFYTNDGASFSMFRKGPCLHFHVRTIKKLRDLLHQYGSYAQVCVDPEYVELLYATLTAWGMNPVGGRINKNRLEADEVGLQDFEKFQENLKNLNVETLDNLKKYKLGYLEKFPEQELEGFLKHVYDYLAENRIMKSKRAIVGVSKVLHHLLPDLLVPVDGEHILKFLHRLEEKEYRPRATNNYDTFDAYFKCIMVSYHIAKALAERGIREPSKWVQKNPKFQIERRDMDTSIPKMIDNALIGLSDL